MRVALIADTFSVQKGTGIARYSAELLRGLRNHGLAVETICPAAPNLPFGQAINHAFKMPYHVRRGAARYDLIHATSPIAALAFPAIGQPKVVTYHDLFSLKGRNAGAAIHTRLAAPFFLRIGRFADRIIANSTATKEEMVERLGMPQDRISVMSWGIGEIFRPRRQSNSQGAVVGYVGALNRRKGLPYLIRSFNILRARHPAIDAKLVLCGAGKQEYGRLVRFIAELGLSKVVEFKGSLTDDELVNAYNSFDVFVLPSEWEGFGLPILEAQRCGVPVIIRADAHIPEEVSKYCLKATCEEDMAEKIYELLTDTQLRNCVTERGLEYSQQFTWEKTVQETLQVYEQVMS